MLFLFAVPNLPILTNVIRTHAELAKILWIPLTPDEARGVLTNLRIVYTPATNGTCSYSSIHGDGMKQMNMAEEIDMQSEAIIDGLKSTEQYCVAIQVSTTAGESGFSQVQLLSRKCSKAQWFQKWPFIKCHFYFIMQNSIAPAT